MSDLYVDESELKAKANGHATGEYHARRAHLMYFRRVLRQPKLRTVCEIGFNAGHGAAMWLEGTGVERLQSFDLPSYPYAVGARNLSMSMYPGRVAFHDGDSRTTVAEYASAIAKGLERPCDLAYVDGNHQRIFPLADIVNSLRSSHNGTILIADDCTRHWPAVPTAYDTAVQNGHLRPMREVIPNDVLPTKFSYNRTGWCAGVVASTMAAPVGIN